MTITATITSKGQVTIPVAIRRLLDLATNDLLVFTVSKPREIVVTPIKTDLMSLQGVFKAKKYIPLSVARKKMRIELGKQLEREHLWKVGIL